VTRIGTEDQIFRPHFPGHRLVSPLHRPAQDRVLRDIQILRSFRQTQPHDVRNHTPIITLPKPGPVLEMHAISRYHGEGGRGGLSEFHNGREEVLPDAITLIIELRDGQDSDWKKGATTDFFGVLNHAS